MSDKIVVIQRSSPQVIEVVSPDAPAVVEVIVQGKTGERGPPGPPGMAAPTGGISADADNRLINGTDGGLHVPDLTTDVLAYYILAKN